MFVGLGALLGALLARLIVPDGLKLIFATLALVLGARMLRGAKRQGGTGPTLSSRLQNCWPASPVFCRRSWVLVVAHYPCRSWVPPGATCTAPWQLGLSECNHRGARRGRLYDRRLVDTGLAALYAWLCAFIGAGGDDTGQHAGRTDWRAVCHLMSARQLELVFAGFLLLSGTRMVLALV